MSAKLNPYLCTRGLSYYTRGYITTLKGVRILLFKTTLVWQDRKDVNTQKETKAYIEDCIEQFREKGIRTAHKYLNSVLGSCYGDKKNAAVINYNGNVYKCTARNFTEENKEGVLNDDGEIVWIPEKYQLRRTIRLFNPVCQRCRIAPICGGTCSQQQIERRGVRGCLYGYSEADKDEIVLNKFYADVVRNHI